jgi:hypothetical protein
MAAALSIAYTTTPLAAGVKLMIKATPQLSAGVTVLPKSKLRFVMVSAAAAASPANILAAYTALFGSLVAGSKIFFELTPISATGLAGAPLTTSIVVS